MVLHVPTGRLKRALNVSCPYRTQDLNQQIPGAKATGLLSIVPTEQLAKLTHFKSHQACGGVATTLFPQYEGFITLLNVGDAL
jgi:hypothetical protein